MGIPTTKVEIAFSTQPEDPSPVYVNVTSYTRLINGINITRGRQDQYETVQPARLSLTLINRDGRFTPGNVTSPYYPNVKKGRRIRVSETWAGVTYIRFTGFIDEWPVEWADASATVADVQITATSRMARLGHGKTLASVIEVEYLLDNPVAYYTLGEDVGSLQAGNGSATVQPPMTVTPFGGGSNANITFGSATGPATDSLTAAAFTRVSAAAGAYLTMTSPNVFSQGTVAGSVLIEAWFVTSSAQEMGIANVDSGSVHYAVALGVSATGKLTGIQTNFGSVQFSLASTATVSDGLLHHAALRVTDTTGNTVASLFLDGTLAASTTLTGDFWRLDLQRLVGGGGIVNSAYSGTLAHVAVYATAGSEISSTRIQQHYLAGTTGFSGERSDQRIQRLATYAGVPSADVVVETGLSTSIGAQDTTDQQPIQLMQDVTSTEGGVLFDAGDGRLTFHARSHRYNASSVLTLATSSREIMPSLTPRLDDQDLVNDVTATRTGGVSARVVDLPSVAEYGTYREDISLLTTSDNEVFDAASWKVYTASTPQVKVPTAEVELALFSTAQTTTLLAREIGDRITLSGLPVQAPAASMDFFIEGWTETIADFTYRIVFNLSSASLSGVWQIDSSTYSVLNTSTRLAY
jgi:hypothetical protein